MIATQYTVATPHGQFSALWDEDEAVPVRYAGNAEAQAYFGAYLALKTVSGRNGAVLSMDSLEPADLYGFCQSAEYGVLVLPEFDELVAILGDEQADAEASDEDLIGLD